MGLRQSVQAVQSAGVFIKEGGETGGVEIGDLDTGAGGQTAARVADAPSQIEPDVDDGCQLERGDESDTDAASFFQGFYYDGDKHQNECQNCDLSE